MIVRNENIVARKVHDATFLINITENYSEDKCHLYEINEIGTFIWDKLADVESTRQIADLLYEAIDEDVPYETILEDTKTFIAQLSEMGFIGGEYA